MLPLHFWIAVVLPAIGWSLAWYKAGCQLTRRDAAVLVLALALSFLYTYGAQESHDTHLLPTVYLIEVLALLVAPTVLSAVKIGTLTYLSMLLPDILVPLPSIRDASSGYLDAVLHNLPYVGGWLWLDALLVVPLLVIVGVLPTRLLVPRTAL